MSTLPTRWTRRGFLRGAGIASLVGSGVADRSFAAERALEQPALGSQSAESGTYRTLGVRPLINAAGTYTALSASIMPSEVVAAMEEAARQNVSIAELQQAVGDHIAKRVGAEAALVTAGCAAALTAATAACVCGTDEELIRRVPDTAGMKDEVIFQKSHRFSYDHAIRNIGVRIVEVETREELQAAINGKTAMLFFLNAAESRGQIGCEEFARIAKDAQIPSLIDVAADLPPASNLWAFTKMGYDLVAFSGGKGLRGPQCSGLLLGRRDLIDAAFLNGSPNSDTVARIAKVGKEEIVGLWKAIELYLARDHEAEWAEWERRVDVIAERVSHIRSVHAEQFVPEIANHVPHLAVSWDPEVVPLTRSGVAQALRDGEPRIELRPSEPDEPRLEIGVWMLQSGEAEIVARRCAEVLTSAAA